MVMTFFSLCLSWRIFLAHSITKGGLLDTVISGTFFHGLEAVLRLPGYCNFCWETYCYSKEHAFVHNVVLCSCNF